MATLSNVVEFNPRPQTNFTTHIHIVKAAEKAGFCTKQDILVLQGKYGQLQGEARDAAYLQAGYRAETYVLATDKIALHKLIGITVAKRLACSALDILEIFTDGLRFEAVDDRTNQKISGTFEIQAGLVRFTFDEVATEVKTLHQIRNEVLKQELDETSAIGLMMDQWLMQNPVPVFTSLDDCQHAVEKAYWVLRKDEACTFFNNESYPLDVPAHRWNIKQAIINRPADQTMLQAAIAYVEILTANLP